MYKPLKLLTLNSFLIGGEYAYWPDEGINDPWAGYPYQWEASFRVQSWQVHSDPTSREPFAYNGLDIKIGDYIVTSGLGKILRIANITSQDTDYVTCIVEDVNRENLLQAEDQSGFGEQGDALLFEVKNGIPLISPIQTVVNSIPQWFAADIFTKFFYKNLTNEIEVTQVAHNFSIGDTIALNQDGSYTKANANSVENSNIIGFVTEINVSTLSTFKYRPIGALVDTELELPGNPGDILYIDPITPGALTPTKPQSPNLVISVFKKIRDSIAILWPTSSTIEEAPSDDKQYVRKNATWTELAATETSTRAKQVVDDYVAKYSLETYKIVTTDETEKILPANPYNDVHADRVIGMTVEPIAENNIGKVLEVGAIEDLTWTWNINTLVYLGDNGTMTQLAPTSGNLVVLAKPLSPTKILFNPQAPIWIAPA